jgi:transketolase
MTHFAIQAAQQLSSQGISVELLHYPSTKPFDEQSLINSAMKTRGVVTVEQQSIIGGLGGAVCEVLSESLPTPVKRLGIPDRFGEVGTEHYLFEKHGLGLESIERACTAMSQLHRKGLAACEDRLA